LWFFILIERRRGPSWLWSHGSWIYNYLCNQSLSRLMLWVRISIRARCTTLCTMYRFERIESYYFIMWCIWHEIMNSSVQSDICFVTELLNLVYWLNVHYSNPRFCKTQFMQEYPINKHEITIIVNQYLVKDDWF
jgi:hypothetical protein